MRIKNHLHIKGRALNLVLIQRPGGTPKWPIECMNIELRVRDWMTGKIRLTESRWRCLNSASDEKRSWMTETMECFNVKNANQHENILHKTVVNNDVLKCLHGNYNVLNLNLSIFVSKLAERKLWAFGCGRVLLTVLSNLSRDLWPDQTGPDRWKVVSPVCIQGWTMSVNVNCLYYSPGESVWISIQNRRG